jgi:hypothetical protein
MNVYNQSPIYLFYLKKNRMAHPNIALINALQEAAKNLRNGAHYAWGHHGSCNCGHVLQVVTRLSKEEIVRHAQTVMANGQRLPKIIAA